jgi:hypothetical protein
MLLYAVVCSLYGNRMQAIQWLYPKWTPRPPLCTCGPRSKYLSNQRRSLSEWLCIHTPRLYHAPGKGSLTLPLNVTSTSNSRPRKHSHTACRRGSLAGKPPTQHDQLRCVLCTVSFLYSRHHIIAAATVLASATDARVPSCLHLPGPLPLLVYHSTGPHRPRLRLRHRRWL